MQTIWTTVLLAVTAALAFSCAPEPEVLARGGRTAIVFEDVTVVNGADGPRIDHATVVVDNGRLAFVGRDDGTRWSDTERVRGGYLIPGLIDQHAHATIRPMTSAGAVSTRADMTMSAEVLALLLRSGITTARNPEAPLPDGVALRDGVAEGRITGPALQTAGPVISAGYNVETVRAEVRRQAKAGVDWIKLGSAITPDVLSAAVQEAHAAGIKAVGHLQRTTWTDAAHAGIDAITHGAPWSPDYLPAARRPQYVQSMKGRLDWLEWIEIDSPQVQAMIRELRDRRVWLDPTLVAYDTKFRGDDERHRRSPDLSDVPAAILNDWSRWTFTHDWTAADYQRGHGAWPKVLALINAYWRGGVRMTTGSDFPNPWVVPGAGLHTELELLVAAGIPPLDVLAMATSRGAEALGLAQDVGTIAVGKRANLVWLRADPSVDIRNTRTIRGVLKDGRWVHRID